MRRIKISFELLILIITLSFVACVPVKKLSYFNDIGELGDPGINPRIQKTIMPFDKLYIRILSIDAQTNEIFNYSETSGSISNTPGLLGYLVDETGTITVPFAGGINVGSLTTAQAADKIQKALSEYAPNISVIVKFVDNQVTVVGEVQRQGVYNFVQDKINIYEAIGLGGGINRYGNRKNIILIRNEGEKIMHYKLNLSDSKIAGKDTYYILPNDVIVVEPLKAISSSYANVTYTTILSTVTTALAILLFLGFGL